MYELNKIGLRELSHLSGVTKSDIDIIRNNFYKELTEKVEVINSARIEKFEIEGLFGDRWVFFLKKQRKSGRELIKKKNTKTFGK